jgi:hypothetical protein
MLQQAQWIKDFCDKEGFRFIDCDDFGIKVPCGLDRGYKENNDTIFISGFIAGSKKIKVSYGGAKQEITLRMPINEIPIEGVKKICIPNTFICAKCGIKNLNLRTQDDHKSYVCPECYK